MAVLDKDELIRYAKEVYGVDIHFEKSDKPVTFEEIFGIDLSQCDNVLVMPDCE